MSKAFSQFITLCDIDCLSKVEQVCTFYTDVHGVKRVQLNSEHTKYRFVSGKQIIVLPLPAWAQEYLAEPKQVFRVYFDPSTIRPEVFLKLQEDGATIEMDGNDAYNTVCWYRIGIGDDKLRSYAVVYDEDHALKDIRLQKPHGYTHEQLVDATRMVRQMKQEYHENVHSLYA